MAENGRVQPQLVDELEEFVRQGDLWDQAEVEHLVDRLESESRATGDPNPGRLSSPFRALLVRMRAGDVSDRMAHEIEAVVLPRLWKVMEAARDGLPPGEVRTRIEVLDRRLSRTLAEEAGG